MDDPREILQRLALYIPAMLVGFTVHEAAHAWIAKRLGDDTAERAGRITFNPLAHLDPVGSAFLLLAVASNSPIAYGWARPTPVDVRNLRKPRRDSVFVTLAGITANLLTAIVAAMAYRLVVPMLAPPAGDPPHLTTTVAHLLDVLVLMNLSLAAFNLLPIPPLDGGNALVALLPAHRSETAAAIAGFLLRNGIWILLAYVLLSALVRPVGRIVSVPVLAAYTLLLT